ncbi:baseplate J/gp47 family protein [Streptomyces sp. RKAG293]|uniref:baseplate J/gp47 family protein n=1 Tax=Streptomyces sp. RKAG293 TaxID=2893403 RepID=UPI0020346A91|nr:baseplate J/gp47 family protein [Streptomyces sp. RKAG293]MCM2422895.1 baseplate J/gp47 family protein [Streptomyces sp. RKAG293]
MTDLDGTAGLEELARTSGSGKPFGITAEGFVPKPLARLLEEKQAAARVLFGTDVDLTAGSALRKVLEIIALEEARAWVHLGLAYDDSRLSTAVGDALSRLGAEIGVPRPHLRATGRVAFSVSVPLPAGTTEVSLPRGTRLLSPGGHDYFTSEDVTLTGTAKQADVAVTAFEPGPGLNIDPQVPDATGDTFPGKLDRFNPLDPAAALAAELAAAAGHDVLGIDHRFPTTGGELFWSDARYRDLLLAYPRSLWTPDAVRIAVSLVPGVRQVLIKDPYGGLDINQAVFGSFSFLERLFSQERSLGDPYFFTVLVAPEEGAFWEGPGQLREQVAAAVEQVRPIGISPHIEKVGQVGIGFRCRISVDGLPVPVGDPAAMNAAPEAVALKARILDRVRRRLQTLAVGEPVRYSEVLWAVMEEQGVTDARALRLRRYPPPLPAVSLTGPGDGTESGPHEYGAEEDAAVGPAEIALLVDSLADIEITIG